MIDGMGQFKQFYEATNKHRKLGWVYALGTCHVKGNFDARPVELILTTFQATLLLLFNTGQRLCLSASIGGRSCVCDDCCMCNVDCSCKLRQCDSILQKTPAYDWFAYHWFEVIWHSNKDAMRLQMMSLA